MRKFFLKKSSKQEIVKIAEFFSEKKGCFFFHSPRDEKLQKSYLFLYPNQAVSIVDKKYSKKQEKFETFIEHDENVWENLKIFLKDFDENLEKFPKWVGFFSYEMGSKLSLTKMPYAYFQKSTVVFYFDHESKDLFLYLDENNFKNLENFDKKIISQIMLEKNFSKILKKEKNNDKFSNFQILQLENYEKYCQKIRKIKEKISLGDVYQVNLSHEILLEKSNDKFSNFSFFQKLMNENPSNFSVFSNLNNFQILSISPERFLKKFENVLKTSPVKGTTPRSKDILQDLKNRKMLENSEKLRSELLMIMDLCRNDFYKISKKDSIFLEKKFEIEKYSNVYQLVSTITSKSKNLHPIDVIKEIFPAGSITGCPKKASQQAIFELEKRERGLFTGNIGFIYSNGDFDFNIAIRTATISKNILSLQLGGAIVIDSNEREEYYETLVKGKTFFNALGVNFENFIK